MSAQESTLVVSAHAADLPQVTLAEAYMRVFPQATDRLA